MRYADDLLAPAVGAGKPAMDVRAWTAALFQAIDAKDCEGFMRFVTDDARFQFANLPPAVGAPSVREAVAGFFASVASIEHVLRATWGVPGHVVCRGSVNYTRHDARVVTLDFCNVLALDAERVADYRVYIDAAPLFAS